MDLGSEVLKSLIDDSIQRALEKKKSTEEYYKNLNKHTHCSKCYDKITHDNYKKDRSICRKCYSKYMLEYNSSRRGVYNKLDSSRKDEVSSKINSSNNFDYSNKQVRSSKKDCSNKQVNSSNQVISCDYIIDVDPNLLSDRLREFLSKPDMTESDYTRTKMILDELLRTESIPKKQCNALRKQIGLV